MNGYLDADALRRQANTVVRLTVVTIFGLIGTVTTGRVAAVGERPKLVATRRCAPALRVPHVVQNGIETLTIAMCASTRPENWPV